VRETAEAGHDDVMFPRVVPDLLIDASDRLHQRSRTEGAQRPSGSRAPNQKERTASACSITKEGYRCSARVNGA